MSVGDNLDVGRPRAIWIDKLRIISCFAVILIHVSGEAYNRFGMGETWEWWLANLMNGTSRAAVPLFVMISGALMKESDCHARNFYKKKASRFFPVILVWSIFYAIFDWVVMGLSPRDITLLLISKGHVYLHLWYLSMFVFILAFAPYLARLKYRYSGGTRDRWILLSTCVAVVLIDWIFEFLSQINGVPFNFWTRTFVEFIPYFLLGLLLTELEHVRAAFRNGIFLLAALAGCWVVNFLACRYFDIVQDTMPLSNRSPFVMAVAVAVFLMVRHAKGWPSKQVWVGCLADASFGIYLFHPILIWLFGRLLRGTGFNILSGWWMVPTAVVVYLISFVLVFMLRRFPVGRRIC